MEGAVVTGVREMTVGVLGGTGAQGRGLAIRWAHAGLKVVIGSRKAERAQQAAAEIAETSGGRVRGLDNAGCAAAADLVVVGLPWDAHAETLQALREPLAGKIVVDCVNPLGFDKKGPYALEVPEGSAAQQAEALLADVPVPGSAQWPRLSAAPIVNVHVVYDRPVLREPFAAVLDSPLQWLFDRTGPSGLARGQYLAISLSAAQQYVEQRTTDLRALFLPALREVLPAAREARVRDFFVTREPRATFAQT